MLTKSGKLAFLQVTACSRERVSPGTADTQQGATAQRGAETREAGFDAERSKAPRLREEQKRERQASTPKGAQVWGQEDKCSDPGSAT